MLYNTTVLCICNGPPCLMRQAKCQHNRASPEGYKRRLSIVDTIEEFVQNSKPQVFELQKSSPLQSSCLTVKKKQLHIFST